MCTTSRRRSNPPDQPIGQSRDARIDPLIRLRSKVQPDAIMAWSNGMRPRQVRYQAALRPDS